MIEFQNNQQKKRIMNTKDLLQVIFDFDDYFEAEEIDGFNTDPDTRFLQFISILATVTITAYFVFSEILLYSVPTEINKTSWLGL